MFSLFSFFPLLSSPSVSISFPSHQFYGTFCTERSRGKLLKVLMVLVLAVETIISIIQRNAFRFRILYFIPSQRECTQGRAKIEFNKLCYKKRAFVRSSACVFTRSLLIYFARPSSYRCCYLPSWCGFNPWR